MGGGKIQGRLIVQYGSVWKERIEGQLYSQKCHWYMGERLRGKYMENIQPSEDRSMCGRLLVLEKEGNHK